MANLARFNRIAVELKSLLKRETRLLRAGRYYEVENFAKEKAIKVKMLEKALADLQNSTDKKKLKNYLSPILAEIKLLVNENASLLKGALSGVRSARDKINSLQNKNTLVGAYGKKGKGLSFEEQACSKETSF